MSDSISYSLKYKRCTVNNSHFLTISNNTRYLLSKYNGRALQEQFDKLPAMKILGIKISISCLPISSLRSMIMCRCNNSIAQLRNSFITRLCNCYVHRD